MDKFFGEVEDPRSGQNIGFPLQEILLIALVTFLCAGQTYEDMVDTGRAKLDFLRRFFPYRKGVPSADTFRYVLMALDPKSFGDAFAKWMEFLHEHVEGLVAVDGKCCRGSASAGKSPLNIVNAYCRERGVVLACIDCPDKGNEITVLPELLSMLELNDCVVSLDAMGCQKAVAKQIVGQKGDYLLMLKGNQGNLHKDVKEFFQAHEESDPEFQEPDFTADVYRHQESGHGRHCRWKVVATNDFCPGLKRYRRDWKGLESVVMVECHRTENGKNSYERRFAITSLKPDAARLADLTRGHWCVENNNHWSLDVAFAEDACRARAGHSAKNLGTLRRLSLNVVKHAQKTFANRRSIKRMLRKAAMEDDYLEQLLHTGLKIFPADSNPA